jgi:hypothetical protein
MKLKNKINQENNKKIAIKRIRTKYNIWKKIRGWNWKKLKIISNKTNSNKKNIDQIWRKCKLKSYFENLKGLMKGLTWKSRSEIKRKNKAGDTKSVVCWPHTLS